MKQSKKERILQAALDMIASGGFHKSPISALAEKAKVAVGTIYHYFETKEELITELYIGCGEVQARVAARAAEAPGSYRDRFEAMWNSLYDYTVKHPNEFRFVEQYQHSPFISLPRGARAEKAASPLLTFLKEGVKKEHLKKIDAAILLDFFKGTLTTAAAIHLDKKKMSLGKKECAQFEQMAWSAMKK